MKKSVEMESATDYRLHSILEILRWPDLLVILFASQNQVKTECSLLQAMFCAVTPAICTFGP